MSGQTEEWTLEKIKRELVELSGSDQMDAENRKARIAAMHALADILPREQGK